MEKESAKILFWLPRVLIMLFAVFISLFALDVFSEGQSVFRMIFAFLINLIPTWIIIFTIIVSWKLEWIAGLVFTILGAAYIIIAWGKVDIMAYLIISGPLFIIGILYWLNWIKRDELRPEGIDKARNNHHNREDMTGEHRFGDAGQASIAVLFLIVWLSDPLLLESTTHLNELIPRIIRFPIGIILLISAGYLAISTLKIVFGEVRKPPVVIREGAYKYCRHPMYLAEILLYLGLLIISISFAAFIVWLLAIGFLYFIGRHEEKLLLKRFGDEYRKYMAEVPMWIPRLKRN